MVLWMAWYGVRKRRYRASSTSLQGWLSAHVYLGLAAIVIATLHSGLELGLNLHTLTYVLMLVVVLSGSVAVDRLQPWGERLRLAEAQPGEILGEMSLLDSGMRFSVCTTMSDCELAILSAQGMDEMLAADPTLAANLIALLARKLSLRLRVVSARLSDKK